MGRSSARLRAAAIGALACGALAPAAAHAASYSFQGQTPSGIDPLGGNYAIGLNVFGLESFAETAAQQSDDTQDVTFHPKDGVLADAVSFTFTETGAIDPIEQAFGTGFTHDVPGGEGDAWNATYTGDGQVSFEAPAGDTLVAGDRFFTTVGFANPLPTGFTYTLTWSDSPSATPEPTTWTLMICGVGLAGASLRLGDRRRQAKAG